MFRKKKESRFLEEDDEEIEVVKKDLSKKKILLIVLPIASALIIAIAIIGIVMTQRGYQEAEDEYSNLDEYATIVSDSANDGEDQKSVYESEQEGEIPNFPVIEIDEEGLKAISKDYQCWFYMPAFDLSYPVAQCINNDYYLDHTLEGNYNSAGCLFIDTVNSPDLTDKNTFIYGHNMKNGSMFGKLSDFIKDDRLADLNPNIYLYREGKVYIYSIFAFYITETATYNANPDEDMFRIIDDELAKTDNEDFVYITYDEYLNKARELSVYEPVERLDFSDQPPIITLSTCYGPVGTSKRLLVHAVLVGTYDLPQK